ncbi:MAG TPA: hypothetical protein VK171_14995, partial [Fimbriimonas sp.]|nr:hypothetical protein [Fimbriimonas sp.]
HLFLDDGIGGTILREEIDYKPPFGILGRIFGDWLIRKSLDRMFTFRHETTRRILEGESKS